MIVPLQTCHATDRIQRLCGLHDDGLRSMTCICGIFESASGSPLRLCNWTAFRMARGDRLSREGVGSLVGPSLQNLRCSVYQREDVFFGPTAGHVQYANSGTCILYSLRLLISHCPAFAAKLPCERLLQCADFPALPGASRASELGYSIKASRTYCTRSTSATGAHIMVAELPALPMC